ncbi:MAG: hypothetical protein AAFV53_41670 [Myxococcota bacterium]
MAWFLTLAVLAAVHAEQAQLPPPPSPALAAPLHEAVDVADLTALCVRGKAWMMSDAARHIKKSRRKQEMAALVAQLHQTRIDIREQTDSWIRLADLLREEGLDHAFGQGQAAREWFMQSLEISGRLAIQATDHPRHDAIVYWMIVDMHLLNQTDEVLETAVAFSDLYPDSDYLNDVQLLVGEQTRRRQPDIARSIFEALAPTSPVATYRLAQIQLQDRDFNAAIQTLQAITARDDLPPAFSTMILETLITASRSQNTDPVKPLAALAATPQGPRQILAFARQSFAAGWFEDSALAYQALIQQDPNGADAPIYHYEIVRAHMAADQPERAKVASDDMRARYDARSSWWDAQADQPDARQTARTLIGRLDL